ncbi:type II toxin-antitoxin system PemK/MazF family toxin [Nostoc sp.]|uniref:type II toxin-antitoxin system PemK/MazF family toxin n=1 Tax=Nostoc sp. TaxID=1180 RepID=UPI003FA5C2F3
MLPSHVFVPASIGGLSQDSVVLCEQLRVVDKSRIIRVIGHFDDNYLDELAIALYTILKPRIMNNNID